MSYMTFTVDMFIYCEFNLPTQKISKKHNTRERSEVAISVGFVLVKEFTSAFQADKTVVFSGQNPHQHRNAVTQEDLRKGFSETLPSSCEHSRYAIWWITAHYHELRRPWVLGELYEAPSTGLKGNSVHTLTTSWPILLQEMWKSWKEKNTSYTNHAPGCV